MRDRWHLVACEESQMVEVKVAISGLRIFGECLFSISIDIYLPDVQDQTAFLTYNPC